MEHRQAAKADCQFRHPQSELAYDTAKSGHMLHLSPGSAYSGRLHPCTVGIHGRVLSRIPTVTSFISDQDQDTDRWSPSPMSEVEVARFLNGDQRQEHGTQLGDAVRITEGPFTDAIAKVESSDASAGRVRVSVNIFGRPTPPELTVSQIAKAD